VVLVVLVVFHLKFVPSLFLKVDFHLVDFHLVAVAVAVVTAVVSFQSTCNKFFI
jgi:hypothetical protein